MKKILLDTNAYSAFFSGNEDVLEALSEAEVVLMSVIVLGELFAGFQGGTKFSRNKALLEDFLSKPTVQLLDVSRETAEIFGEIKHQLKKEGTPIPLNDVWLAAQALETGARLVSLDSHFGKVKGLRMWEKV